MPLQFYTKYVIYVLNFNSHRPTDKGVSTMIFSKPFQDFLTLPQSSQSYLSDSPSSSCRFSRGDGNSKVLLGVRGVPSMESLAGGASPGCFKPAPRINVRGEEPNQRRSENSPASPEPLHSSSRAGGTRFPDWKGQISVTKAPGDTGWHLVGFSCWMMLCHSGQNPLTTTAARGKDSLIEES